MRIYAVSFPTDLPVLTRLVELDRKEILLSYYFLRDGCVLRDTLQKITQGSS